MAITDKQLASRSEGIGSSDAAAILGYSPWKNGADVQLEKLGQVTPDEAGELAEIGTALEPGILKLASQRLNCRIVRPTGTYKHESGVLLANIDGQVEKAARGYPIVEAKDSGLDEAWGEAGTDQVPPYVLIQVCHQLVCSTSTVAHVPRLGRGFNRGFFLYQIERKGDVAKLCDTIEDFLPKWWHKHIVNQEPVTGKTPNLDVLKRVIRVPSSARIIDADVVARWELAKKANKATKELLEARQAELIQALGDAEAGVYEGGAVTYYEIKRAGYTVQPTSYRQLKEVTNTLALAALATKLIDKAQGDSHGSGSSIESADSAADQQGHDSGSDADQEVSERAGGGRNPAPHA